MNKISSQLRFSLNDFQEELIVESPGRINLIGEHTDYNNGFVLPTAIDKKIEFRFKKNNTNNSCTVYSQNFDNYLQFNLGDIQKSKNGWENYILGVLFELQKKTKKIKGFDCIINSKLPMGSGLSSSAALECGLAVGLNELFALNLSREELIIASRDAEHSFVGTKCGIMDQYASAMSKEGHVILLDCDTLSPKWIPFELGEYRLLLLNTNVTHKLAESEYNTRRTESEQGLAIIQEKNPEVKSLRDVTIDLLDEFKEKMSPLQYKRCKYVLDENQRVLDAADALLKNNLSAFGKLLYNSHLGQQFEYEISCKELDFLVEYSKAYDYILGSRMMGGGFGGCTINIIHKNHLDTYIKSVSDAYKKQFKISLDAFQITPSNGTSIKRIS